MQTQTLNPLEKIIEDQIKRILKAREEGISLALPKIRKVETGYYILSVDEVHNTLIAKPYDAKAEISHSRIVADMEANYIPATSELGYDGHANPGSGRTYVISGLSISTQIIPK
ncbi:MAG: hypothetical protein AABX51_01695 [Nanoarchaeota archaeon]